MVAFRTVKTAVGGKDLPAILRNEIKIFTMQRADLLVICRSQSSTPATPPAAW